MKITNSTQFADIEKSYDLFSDETRNAIIQHALNVHGVEDFNLLSIGELIRVTSGDVSFFGIKEDGTVFEVVFVMELKKFVQNYVETLASYQVPQTIDEKSASAKCSETTFAEGLLIFARNYFNLKSFEEAERIKLAELLIAKKDAYNNAVFQKEITKIQLAKYK